MNDAEKEVQTPERAKRKPMKSLWRVLNVAALAILIAAGIAAIASTEWARPRST